MIAVARALEILRASCTAGAAERSPLGESLNRVLAREIRSDVDWPPFDTSAMDGYAVRVADVPAAGTALRERPGLVAAGDRPASPIGAGEAIRVMTGAPLPGGTEAVIPVEEVRRGDGKVEARSVPRAGEHIRRRGESVSAGALLLPRGKRLAPADVALAALAGAEPAEVYRRPRIAIAVTGNELVAASSRPGPGQLRDSNGPMLLALCGRYGATASAQPAVADEEGSVRRLFEAAGGAEDVLLTSGGVSAGDLDLLPEIAAKAGFEILFHGVAMRPGKPIAFGRREATLWFGLPGNPVSTSVCFHIFVRYALDLLEGVDPQGPATVSARLSQAITIRGRRETYLDATLSTVDGENRAGPLASRGSHDLATHARANALIRIPADAGSLAMGALVDCLPL